MKVSVEISRCSPIVGKLMYSFLDHVDSNGTEIASQVPTLSTKPSHLKFLLLGAVNQPNFVMLRFCSRDLPLP